MMNKPQQHLKIFLMFLALVITGSVSGEETVFKKDYRIKPVLFTSVRFHDNFWAPKIETNRKVSIPSAFKKCEETGRIDNFAVAGGLKTGEFKGDYPFDDTDVYKVVEGASYALAVQYDREMDEYLDGIIQLIAAAQEEDGYLYTCRTSHCTRENIIRWMGTERWQRLNSHELYNCGHLYEAAAAHYLATGKSNLLDIAIKNADLIARVFGPGKNQKHVPSGHPIIEMALVKLYRVTGKTKYLDLAQYFIDETGRGTDGHPLSPYSQDHMPIVSQQEAVGHAVRFGYLYSGVTDAAALTGNPAYIKALERVWQNIVEKKLYITGGIGARAMGEGFGGNYELPNMTAYCETCASIAYVFWNYRMFLLSGDSKYYDILERTLYNSLLSGVSEDGRHFFYDNPLESNGEHKRQEWFGCACCPGNVTRFMASIPGYQYAVKNDGIFVNLFVAGKASITFKGTEVTVRQETRYPWDGRIKLKVNTPHPMQFNWYIRIPAWTKNQVVPSGLYSFKKHLKTKVTIRVNGKKVDYREINGYARIPGKWQARDEIDLELPMQVRRIETNPKVVNNRGKIALQRGPLVYCLEGIDHNNGFMFDSIIPGQEEIKSQYEKDLLKGVVTLSCRGKKLVKENHRTVEKEILLKAIPYYTWNNRGQSCMVVWIPQSRDAAIVKPEPTIASKSKPAASIRWVSGLNDGFDPRDSNDTDKLFFYWWLKKGTMEWVEYTFDQPYVVSGIQVYWLYFDHYDYVCRPPRSWEILYRQGDRWVPVQSPSPYTTKIHRYNTVTFSPVKTTGLRISAQLQTDFSAGIMEWKVF
jgi:DUF1680 family protein